MNGWNLKCVYRFEYGEGKFLTELADRGAAPDYECRFTFLGFVPRERGVEPDADGRRSEQAHASCGECDRKGRHFVKARVFWNLKPSQ